MIQKSFKPRDHQLLLFIMGRFWSHSEDFYGNPQNWGESLSFHGFHGFLWSGSRRLDQRLVSRGLTSIGSRYIREAPHSCNNSWKWASSCFKRLILTLRSESFSRPAWFLQTQTFSSDQLQSERCSSPLPKEKESLGLFCGWMWIIS